MKERIFGTTWLSTKVRDAGRDWGQMEKRASEHEMAGWHRWCNGHELGQTSGDGEGQGGLLCCSPWGHKELDTTRWVSNSNYMSRMWSLQGVTFTVREMCVIAQSCLTLCNPVDCSLPVSSVCGISQARILEWVAISFSRGSSWPRDRTWVSCTAGRCFTIWATR